MDVSMTQETAPPDVPEARAGRASRLAGMLVLASGPVDVFGLRGADAESPR